MTNNGFAIWLSECVTIADGFDLDIPPDQAGNDQRFIDWFHQGLTPKEAVRALCVEMMNTLERNKE